MSKHDDKSPVISREIIALYDEYTHAPLPRRVFMKRLSAITGSTVAASALLPVLENNYAQAAVVDPADARIVTRRESFEVAGKAFGGLLAVPAKRAGKPPAVLVIHENRGLNPHIEDLTRRLAVEGFMAFGVDYLSAMGGTQQDDDLARDMIAKLNAATIGAVSVAAVDFLAGHAGASGKVGAIGFCWGGGAVNQLAVLSPRLAAGIAFYGMQPKTEDVPKIRAPLQLHYAGLDERINAGIPAYEAALKAAGKRYEIYVYEGVNHAFNNDTNAARYDAKAAARAWSRSLAFLRKYLA